jgi:hypothetical protein
LVRRSTCCRRREKINGTGAERLLVTDVLKRAERYGRLRKNVIKEQRPKRRRRHFRAAYVSRLIFILRQQ